jgi:peptide-methionine (S)-S-oxide reductase
MTKATFAAGCFWGVEAQFRKIKGVTATRVGYTGGHVADPSYTMVCQGNTQHAEAIEIDYDPTQISYNELLGIFWQVHNPTSLNKQGPDMGSQYRSAIFFHTPSQEQEATASRAAEQQSGRWQKQIVTEIIPATTFYVAEDYHQRYLEKQGLALPLASQDAR